MVAVAGSALVNMSSASVVSQNQNGYFMVHFVYILLFELYFRAEGFHLFHFMVLLSENQSSFRQDLKTVDMIGIRIGMG